MSFAPKVRSKATRADLDALPRSWRGEIIDAVATHALCPTRTLGRLAADTDWLAPTRLSSLVARVWRP